MFNIEDYNYYLPEALIAQVPSSKRDRSRLLVVDLDKETLSDQLFFDLPHYLKPGDLLVVNNTRVVPARLFGRKETGGQIELLVLDHPTSIREQKTLRKCMVKASKRPKKGTKLFFEMDVEGCVEDLLEDGITCISFSGPISIDSLLEKKGLMPLPPYIKRNIDDKRKSMDIERYQTVYGKQKGAVAAPTAGLHFSEELIKNLNDSGISIVDITLHVGHGTFRPVRTDDIRDHILGEENYCIDSNAANKINKAKREGRRIIAVGTTVVRTLETVANRYNHFKACGGNTGLLITPGFNFKIVDGIITNFHLPKSSLLFLVSAFAGLKRIKWAYDHAIEKDYRFYSYGDAMLII